jgi:hypothetical protein
MIPIGKQLLKFLQVDIAGFTGFIYSGHQVVFLEALAKEINDLPVYVRQLGHFHLMGFVYGIPLIPFLGINKESLNINLEGFFLLISGYVPLR